MTRRQSSCSKGCSWQLLNHAACVPVQVAGTTVFAGPKPSDVIVPELVGLIAAGLREQQQEQGQQ